MTIATAAKKIAISIVLVLAYGVGSYLFDVLFFEPSRLSVTKGALLGMGMALGSIWPFPPLRSKDSE